MAGILQKTLIVTLPGSVKAVKENMEALLTDGLISHAIDLIRGGSGEARHATLSSSDVSAQGRSHHRHHVHHHVHPHDHETPRPRTLFTQDTTTPGKFSLRIFLIADIINMQWLLDSVSRLSLSSVLIRPLNSFWEM